VPAFHSRAVVTASVSGAASNWRSASPGLPAASTTVRQTPDMATEAPIAGSATGSIVLIDNRRTRSRSTTAMTVPTELIMPVNISGRAAIAAHDVVADVDGLGQAVARAALD